MGLFDQLAGAALSTGAGILASKVGTDKLPILNKGLNIARSFMKGGSIMDALDTAVNSGILTDVMKQSSPYRRAMGEYLGSNLHAKLSIKDVERITALAFAIEHSRKNLWLLNISPYQSSVLGTLGGFAGGISGMIGSAVGGKVSNMLGSNPIANLAGKATSQLISSAIDSIPLLGNDLASVNGGGTTSMINMLATDINYSLITFEGEQYNVGSAVIDGPKVGGPVEFTITTMDDEYGTIKRTFEQWASNVIHSDGTVGVMNEGLVLIRILHSFVGDNVNLGGYEQNIIARPVSVEYDLSRREQAMEEFSMRFIQTDTFIR